MENNIPIIQTNDYKNLLANISQVYTDGRIKATRAVNIQLTDTYWQISQKPSHQLSWSHYVELLKIDDPLERNFYEKQSIIENWSVPELKRQKDTALFLRLASGKNKGDVLQLASNGRLIAQASDLLRDPYVFEFLKIPEPYLPSENQLETLLFDHLQQFLLELGKGFTFVGSQYRITISNRHYKVDLVFYHRIFRCFVLIDLKINELQHDDIGQMNSQLFVQKYQLYLPNEQELRRELEKIYDQSKN